MKRCNNAVCTHSILSFLVSLSLGWFIRFPLNKSNLSGLPSLFLSIFSSFVCSAFLVNLCYSILLSWFFFFTMTLYLYLVTMCESFRIVYRFFFLMIFSLAVCLQLFLRLFPLSVHASPFFTRLKGITDKYWL